MDCNSLPVSIVISPANQHDSTRFIDAIESISDHLSNSATKKIKSVYADKGYDSHSIRDYLKNRNIKDYIPKRNFKPNSSAIIYHTKCNKTRFTVERFFAWLKCGFHRTRIRYERIAENYLGLLNIASFLMYCKVLR